MVDNPRRSTFPASLLLLSFFSIIFGAFVHLAALRGPFHDLDNFFALGPHKLQPRALGPALASSIGPLTAKSFGLDAESVSGKTYDKVTRFIFVLLALFQHFLGSRLGKAMLLGIAGHVFPIATFMMTEALKPTRRTSAGVIFGVAVLLIGQAACVGAAMPLFWIPYYAWSRVAEVKSLPQGIYPLGPPPKGVIAFQGVLNIFVVASVLLCAFVPNTSDHFVYANLYFQIFPIIYLPLIAWPAISKLVGIKEDAASSKTTIRSSRVLADNYALVTLGSAVMQIAGVYYAWPSLPKLKKALVTLGQSLSTRKALLSLLHPKAPQRLLNLAQKAARPALSNDGEWLLLIDMLGVLVTALLIVVIDGIVDEWILNGGALSAGTDAGEVKEVRTKRRVARVHGKRSLLKDVIIGLPIMVVLGPGIGLGLYFRNRELMAEKARFEEAKRSGQAKEE